MTPQEHRDKMADNFYAKWDSPETEGFDVKECFKAGYDEAKRSDPDVMALVQLYEPHEDCKEANYVCDYRPMEVDCCPCEFVKRFKESK